MIRTYFSHYLKNDQYLWRDQVHIASGQLKAFINNQFIGTKSHSDIDDIFTFLFAIYRAFEMDDPAAQEDVRFSDQEAFVSSANQKEIVFGPVRPQSSVQLTLDTPPETDIKNMLAQDKLDHRYYVPQEANPDEIDEIIALRGAFDDRRTIIDERARRAYLREQDLVNPRNTTHHRSATRMSRGPTGDIWENANLLSRAVNESGLNSFLELYNWI